MTTSVIKLSNGQSINYFEHGHQNINKKPTLFFIHGHFGCWQWWSNTINVLKVYDYHIIAVDMRGFGDSTYINKCSRFKDWAGDLVDLCNIKKIKECVAIGWSFGGGIAMKFAELAPQLVKKVFLTVSISSNGYICQNAEGIQCKTMQQVKQHPLIQAMAVGIQKLDREVIIATIYLTLLLIPSQHSLIDKCQDMIDGTLKQRCYYDVWYAMANSDININEIKAKGLFLHGKDDGIIQFDDIKQTGLYFKTFYVWQGHAHMIPIQDIQRYADAVRKFAEEK